MNIQIDQRLIDEGYITKRKHPECDYYIYNYTAKTQYERYWNDQTLMCRGLILDGTGEVISRPFRKFFNIGEYNQHSFLKEIPYYTYFDLYEKVDGSLGILYRMPNGEYRVSTRGSFESTQAKKGTELFKKMFPNPEVEFATNWTYLFEIVYPENRIVIDYGQEEKLVLLSVVSTECSEEMKYEELLTIAERLQCPVTQYHSRVAYNRHAFLKLEELIPENTEGFVLQFDHGLRVKIKSDEYKRLHKLITQVSNVSIWECLRNREPLDELLERVPDEFYTWVKTTQRDLTDQFSQIEDECFGIIGYMRYNDLDNADRKYVAEYFKQYKKLTGVLFLLYDQKNYQDVIWKMIRPTYSKPFKGDVK